MKKRVLSIDFDGVIRDTMTDKPIEGTLQALKWLKNKGYMLVISTGRDDLEKVDKWLRENNIPLKASNKKVRAKAYIDDRGIRFINWKDTLNYF